MKDYVIANYFLVLCSEKHLKSTLFFFQMRDMYDSPFLKTQESSWNRESRKIVRFRGG